MRIARVGSREPRRLETRIGVHIDDEKNGVAFLQEAVMKKSTKQANAYREPRIELNMPHQPYLLYLSALASTDRPPQSPFLTAAAKSFPCPPANFLSWPLLTATCSLSAIAGPPFAPFLLPLDGRCVCQLSSSLWIANVLIIGFAGILMTRGGSGFLTSSQGAGVSLSRAPKRLRGSGVAVSWVVGAKRFVVRWGVGGVSFTGGEGSRIAFAKARVSLMPWKAFSSLRLRLLGETLEVRLVSGVPVSSVVWFPDSFGSRCESSSLEYGDRTFNPAV